MLSYILCQPMMQNFMPNNSTIFFTWHISSADTSLFILFLHPMHCEVPVSLFIAFAKHLTCPRKRYRKTAKKPQTHSQNRLNPYACSPFHQTACWQTFTSLFTGMLFLAAGILRTSQQLDFMQTYIHMISLYSHIWTFPR